MTHLATIIIRRFNSAALFCSSIGVLLLISSLAQATEWVILPTVQNGDPGTTATDPNGPTLGMMLWSSVGTNGAISHLIYGQGTGPGYACYGLTRSGNTTCADAGTPVIWDPNPVVFSGSVNDDGSFLDLSWTGQAGTEFPLGTSGLFTASILSGTYNETGMVTGTDPGAGTPMDGYDANGFSCWDNPNSVLVADFCGNGTGQSTTAPPGGGQTIDGLALPAGLQSVVDNMDGTITIGMWNSTYTDCVADGGCTPASGSRDTFAQWRVNATEVIPVPAGIWLFGSALGLLGWIRRKSG